MASAADGETEIALFPGDLALALATRDLLGLSHTPGPRQLAGLAERWRPHRAVAARLLWHDYLLRRGREVGLGEA